MIKILINIVKKLVMSISIIYGLNLILNFANIVVPLNIFNVLYVGIMGIPAVLSILGIITFI